MSPTGGYESVGCDGRGTFNQTGGINNPSVLYLCGQPGGIGTGAPAPVNGSGYGVYNLGGGSLNASLLGMSGGEYIGYQGTGVFNQSGGTNIAAQVVLGGVGYNAVNGSSFATPGIYNLSGGLLQTYLLNAVGTTSTVNPACALTVSGGTLQASANPNTSYQQFTNYLPTITVGSAAGTIATLDANGVNMALNYSACVLTGPGQLRVIDSFGVGSTGVVSLGGCAWNAGLVNTYTGGTTVLSGTLQVLNGVALPTTGLLTLGGPGQTLGASLNLSGQQVNPEGLATLVSSVNPDINFQTAGVDLMTIGDLGMNLAGHTAISFGANPTVLGDYPLFAGNISGFNAANFLLPAAPVGDTYSLQVISGGVDLVVAAVPEPGTLALLGAGLMSLLGFAWRRRKAG